MWEYFWALFSIPLINLSTLRPTQSLNYCDFILSIDSRGHFPTFYILKIVLSILDLLYFNINFRISTSRFCLSFCLSLSVTHKHTIWDPLEFGKTWLDIIKSSWIWKWDLSLFLTWNDPYYLFGNLRCLGDLMLFSGFCKCFQQENRSKLFKHPLLVAEVPNLAL